MINLCEDAAKIFEKEENIIELNGNVIIVGNIHGSFHDLLRIFNYVQNDVSKVLFLGDYVDRCKFSIECITLLFTLKILFPHKFYLLRGNHEFDTMCSNYGFKKEILNYHYPLKTDQIVFVQSSPTIADETVFNFDIDDDEETEKENQPKKDEKSPKLQKEDLCYNYFANHININCYKYSEKLYDLFLKTFSYLPISSIINKNYIYGGLTPLIEKVDDIKKIKRPIFDFDDDPILSDIIWSDPSPEMSDTYSKSSRGRFYRFKWSSNFIT